MEVTLNFIQCCTDSVVVTRGGGQVCSNGKNSITVSGIGFGQRWVGQFFVLSVNGLGKRSDRVNQFMLV